MDCGRAEYNDSRQRKRERKRERERKGEEEGEREREKENLSVIAPGFQRTRITTDARSERRAAQAEPRKRKSTFAQTPDIFATQTYPCGRWVGFNVK